MATSMGHASRFALLKIEDDEDDSDSHDASKQQKSGKDNKQNQAAKKKSKKKKKDAVETADLRNLAFGGKGKSTKDSTGGSGEKTTHRGVQQASDAQWEQWKKSDMEYTSEAYEKDLQQALMMSKLEFEEHKKNPVANQNGQDEGKPASAKDKKKKKKKDKPCTMSLDAFIAGDTKTEEEIKASKPPTPPAEPDPKFFDRVDTDVNKIIQKEKIQEEYTKHYIAESARLLHFQEEIEKKDKEIVSLKGDVKNMEEELKQVKKRNKQLCHILGQGEMKDKADVLLQVQELSQIRDELTQEVTTLQSELEKERSKVHALKAELEKTSGSKGRHGSK